MEMIVKTSLPEAVRVSLNGRLDAPGADQIDLRFTATLATAGQDVLVDLTQVSFVASMGLRLLISVARTLKLKGKRLVLFGAQPLVQNVFEQAAIDQLIPLAASEQEAIERLRD